MLRVHAYVQLISLSRSSITSVPVIVVHSISKEATVVITLDCGSQDCEQRTLSTRLRSSREELSSLYLIPGSQTPDYSLGAFLRRNKSHKSIQVQVSEVCEAEG